MTNEIIKKELEILFTEGLDKFDSLIREKWGHSGLDENGELTSRYKQVLCTNYFIKGSFSNILTGLLKGHTFDSEKEKLNILCRSGLVDTGNNLTRQGYLKAISTLNFEDQIAHLDLPLDQFDQLTPRRGRLLIEHAAENIYSDRYEFVVNDEGALFKFVENCFIYSSRRYFISHGFNPELLESIDNRPFDFIQAVRRGIINGESSILKSVIRGNGKLLEKEDPENNFRIVNKSISNTIKNIDIDLLFEDADQMTRLSGCSRGAGLSYIKIPFNFLGENAVRKIIYKLFEHPTSNNKGWSDLTVFHEGKYIPIEVKGLGDKLRYSQIERLFWLYDNVPEHAKNQRFSKIVFYK